MKADYRIKGAGPAGLTAAIALAKEGAEVEVFESREDCGARFHGDLQGIENWLGDRDFRDELEEWGIEADFLMRPFQKAIGFDDQERRFAMGNDSTIFYVVQRGSAEDSLDQCLKRQALNAGVRLHFEQPILDRESDLVTAGPVGKPRKGLAVSEVFETDLEDQAYVLLDNAAASKGYAYLLIAGGRGCLASILFADFSTARDQMELARTKLARLSGINLQQGKSTGGFTTYSAAPQFAFGDQLFAGEAASLQDPLWGFGVRNAMTSGYLAAQGLLEKLDYQAVSESRFSPLVRAGIVNRWVWEALGHPGYRGILATASRCSDLRNYLHRLCAPSALNRLLFPIARFILHQRAESAERSPLFSTKHRSAELVNHP